MFENLLGPLQIIPDSLATNVIVVGNFSQGKIFLIIEAKHGLLLISQESAIKTKQLIDPHYFC